MQPAQLLPYIVPLIVIAVLYFRTSRSKPRPVSVASLWIVPLVAMLGIGSALWFQPHPVFHVAAYAIFAVALALGIGTGALRAQTLTLRRCPDTGKVLMETSSYAFILLAALVLLRTAFRNMSGGLGVIAVDASMLFALGMIVTQRLTIWMRVRAMPPATSAVD
jgi:Protein of unknown function (DUF1453)